MLVVKQEIVLLTQTKEFQRVRRSQNLIWKSEGMEGKEKERKGKGKDLAA